MSWEHFQLGMDALQHEDGRRFLTSARAARVAQMKGDDYVAEMRAEETLLGLR